MSQLSLSLLVSLAVLAACTPKPGQEPQEPVVKYHEGRKTVVAGEFGYNPIRPMGVYMADPSAKVTGGIQDGSKAAWKYVDFPSGLKKLTVRVRALVGGLIDVRQDQSFYGPVASLDVPSGKGEWLTLECDVKDVKEGPQALWFTFSGDRGSWCSPIELFEIDWFRFE